MAFGLPRHGIVLDIFVSLNPLPVMIKIIPDMYESITGQARVTVLTGIPLIDINPDIITEFQRFNKRLIDIFIASLGLLFLIPLNILIGFFIKATTKGEIIYSQIRVGRDGREFILHKFRTMSENSEKESGRIWAVKNDPRITATDTILRRYRLDEIPQLYNVLKGEMSIVGPRPERPHFVKELKEKVLKLINNINIKNVIIKEPLTKKDLINENAKANIGIVSLKNKNIFRNAIPSKTFEYMSCGLAVICTVQG